MSEPNMSADLSHREIFDSIMNSTADLVVFLTPDLKLSAASKAFSRTTGLDAGHAFMDGLDRFSANGVVKTFRSLEQAGSDDTVSVVLHHKNGNAVRFPVRYSWTACRTPEGSCLGFWGVGRPHSALDDSEVTELHQRIGMLEAERDRRAQEISRLRVKVKEQTHVDELTGLGNRQFILDRIESEVPRAIRYDEPLTILLFDIDHLSKVNEDYGQSVGDTVLREVAGVVRQQVRASDLTGRYSGEEFLILCPHTDRPSAAFLAERLRRRIADLSFEAEAEGVSEEFGITISLGMVTVDAANEFNVEAIVRATEEALCNAKNGGMNRIQLLEAP
jgi:diguanylate cyclase (GGDEF)-like protein